MQELKIQKMPVELRPDLSMWKLEGELGPESIARIQAEFELVLDSKQNFLIAEMSGVTQVSSAAIGQLMGCRQLLSERGGDLVITGVSLDIKSKLSAMGATKIFKFYNELRSAINAYHWEVERKAEKVGLSFPPELQFVPPVRQMVSRIARQKGYSHRDSFRIETIVDEICNNAVEHGSEKVKKNIDLTVQINREKIELEVANASDPDKIENLRAVSSSLSKPPTADAGQRRGRGLALIKMLSNNLDINFSGEGTSVHVTKLREE
jgi:anti-sigma regulatory factor (Ser/Thr protein kinase)/anti-anti-sigma regulatory factor